MVFVLRKKLFFRIIGTLYEAHTYPSSHLLRELKIENSIVNGQSNKLGI